MIISKQVIASFICFVAVLVAACAQPIKTQSEGFKENTKENFKEDFEIRGIYVGASNTILAKLERAENLNVNAVVIDIKDDNGEITCNLEDPSLKSNSSIRDIKTLLNKLKAKGIYTIARIVTFKDKTSDNLLIKNSDGSIYVDKEKMSWLNPYDKKVWEYIAKIAEAAAKVGFDEIQFDYIRLPQYKSLEETEIADDLKKKTKIQVINEFLDFIIPKLRALGVKISADVFGCVIPESLNENSNENSKTSSQKIGQDYVSIAKKVDYICPMIYPSHWPIDSMGVNRPDLDPGKIVELSMAFSKKALGENAHKVRPWLQAFTASWLKEGYWQKYKIEQIQEQIIPLKAIEIKQYCLWNSAAKYEF